MASLAKSVVKGSALGLLAQGLALPVAYLSLPLFLKGLGAVGFGYWGLLQGFFSALNLLAAGTTEATMYFVARDDAEAGQAGPRSRNRALALVVLLGCVLGGIILACGPRWGLAAILRLPAAERDGFSRLLLPAAVLWCFQFWCNWLWLLPRARHEYGVLSANQVALTVAAPLLGWLGMTLGGGDMRTFLWAQSAAWAAGAASIHLWNARHRQPLDLRPGFDPAVLAEVARYAKWAFAFNLGVVVLNSSDRLLLANLGGVALAGYTAASAFTLRVYAVTGSMTSALVPALARIKDGVEIERLRRAFSASLRAIGFLWAALLLPLAAWGDHFMTVWLHNPALAEATYPALLLLCCGAFFGALAAVCQAALMGSGRPRLAAVTGLAGAALGLAVAIPAVGRLGIAGAALLGLVGNGAAFALRIGFMEKSRFKRALAPLLVELGAALALLMAAFMGLRLCATAVDRAGQAATVALMVACAGAAFALGLGLDALASWRRGRPSLVRTLWDLRRESAAENGTL